MEDADMDFKSGLVEILERHGVAPSGGLVGDIMALAVGSRDDPADLSSCLRRFLAAKRADSLSAKTLSNYKGRLSLFVGWMGGARAAASVSPDDIRDYMVSLSDGRMLKPSSRATDCCILKGFFGWMLDEGITSRNPAAKIKQPKYGKKDLRHPLSREDVELMRLACSTPRERAMLEILYSTGCRLGEVAAMTVGAVDFAARSISVTGKGSKARIVYFSPAAKIHLERYLGARIHDGRGALFVAGSGPGAPLGGRSIEKEMKSLGARAGVELKTCPHALRHTFASHALARGMQLDVIRSLLGHETMATTEIYAKMSQSAVKEAYDRLSL
jgi:integrase/recombinase XerD